MFLIDSKNAKESVRIYNYVRLGSIYTMIFNGNFVSKLIEKKNGMKKGLLTELHIFGIV